MCNDRTVEAPNYVQTSTAMPYADVSTPGGIFRADIPPCTWGLGFQRGGKTWRFKSIADLIDVLEKHAPELADQPYDGGGFKFFYSEAAEPEPAGEWPGGYRVNDEPPIDKPYERNTWFGGPGEGPW